MKTKVVMRWNVLYLMSAAYFILLVLFITIAFTKEMTAVDARNMLEAPLMALIGGTLAISKDLITGDDQSSDKNTDDFKNPPPKPGKNDTSGEKQEQ